MDEPETITISLTVRQTQEFEEDAAALGFEDPVQYVGFILDMAHAAREALENERTVFIPTADGKNLRLKLPENAVPTKILNRKVEEQLTDAYGVDKRTDLINLIARPETSANGPGVQNPM